MTSTTLYFVSNEAGPWKDHCVIPHTCDDRCQKNILTDVERQARIAAISDGFLALRKQNIPLHKCGPNSLAEIFSSPEAKLFGDQLLARSSNGKAVASPSTETCTTNMSKVRETLLNFKRTRAKGQSADPDDSPVPAKRSRLEPHLEREEEDQPGPSKI